MIYKAYKYRIYPNPQQTEMIEKTIGVCRLVYNLALEVKIRAWQSCGIRMSGYDLIKQLPGLKQDYSWIAEVDSQAVQASVRKLDGSFKSFFRGSGFPKFKRKRSGGSFQCPNDARRISWDACTLTIPKIKDIPIVLSRRFEGEIKTVTISRTSTGKYFASILVKKNETLPAKAIVIPETAVGVDLGIKTFAVLSDGTCFENPRILKNNLKRLKCLQRRASRKKKGGKNRKKEVKKLAIQYERIANQRNDFLHKFSDAITKQYDTVCVEDLNVKDMTKNRKLAQAISDVGWSTGLLFVKYKCEWRGKNYIEIGRFRASSKTHNKCGFVNNELTLADREWICPDCSELVDRDHNAAINIRDFGLGKYSGVGSPGEPVELRTIVRA